MSTFSITQLQTHIKYFMTLWLYQEYIFILSAQAVNTFVLMQFIKKRFREFIAINDKIPKMRKMQNRYLELINEKVIKKKTLRFVDINNLIIYIYL